MRISEQTLNRGWVGMGWCVSGLLLGAYNDTTHQQYFLVKPCASAQKPTTFPCEAMRVSAKSNIFLRNVSFVRNRRIECIRLRWWWALPAEIRKDRRQGEDNDDHSRGRRASPVHSDTGITEAHERTARRPLAGRWACSRGWSTAVVYCCGLLLWFL